jgi:hypothetical protein
MNTSPTKWLSLRFRKQQSTRANISTDYCLFTNVCALGQQALKKVSIFLLITPFIHSDLNNDEKYAGKVQSALQTGELFLDTFHRVLYRFWNYCVKNTISEKDEAVLSQRKPRILRTY